MSSVGSRMSLAPNTLWLISDVRNDFNVDAVFILVGLRFRLVLMHHCR